MNSLHTFNNTRPSILIVSNDHVGSRMGGVGLRYWRMAQALSTDLDVTLAAPNNPDLTPEGFRLLSYKENQPASLPILVNNHDIALVSGYMLRKFPKLVETKTKLVVDLYDPFVLENLHYFLDQPMHLQHDRHEQAVQACNAMARLGDFFICGNERQRDLWLGLLIANGRINPETMSSKHSIDHLLAVVGVGLPEYPPLKKPVLRGVHPLIGHDAKIVFWGGGIWNWLDPLTLIMSWPEILKAQPCARLVFVGTRHPSSTVPQHEMALSSIEAAKHIGQLDKTIFFLDWVDADTHQALLSESDIGVTLHPNHLETRFSIRTRVVDFIWARLPIVITHGDVTSEWVTQWNLGKVVKEGNVAGVRDAILELLSMDRIKHEQNFTALHDQLSWSNVIAPLRTYCHTGTHAADREIARARLIQELTIIPKQKSWPQRLNHGLTILKKQGFLPLTLEVRQYLRWFFMR